MSPRPKIPNARFVSDRNSADRRYSRPKTAAAVASNKTRNQRLQYHEKTRGHGSPQTERDDVISETRDVSTAQDPERPIRLGPELRRQQIQQSERAYGGGEQREP